MSRTIEIDKSDEELIGLALRVLMRMATAKAEYESEAQVQALIVKLGLESVH